MLLVGSTVGVVFLYLLQGEEFKIYNMMMDWCNGTGSGKTRCHCGCGQYCDWRVVGGGSTNRIGLWRSVDCYRRVSTSLRHFWRAQIRG